MTTKRTRGLIGTALGCVLAVAAAAVLIVLSRQESRPAPLTIHEGWRAGQVYAAADDALSVPRGTTRKAAEKAGRKGRLKLPDAAHGNPEGFFYPGTYPLDNDTTPAQLVATMTRTAHKRLPRTGGDDYPTLTIASIVQAEADTPENMAKVARVIKNRMAKDMPLQMDSTLNYALDRSTLNTTYADTRIESPYNTYRHKGLPPTPINSPGPDALHATKNPADGDWLYFVTVKPGDTRFTHDYAQHEKWVEEFNKEQKKRS